MPTEPIPDPTAPDAPDDIGFDFRLTRLSRAAAGAGTWAIGTLEGHRFDALVFPEPAMNPEFEIPGSRISKLWVQRLADRATVVNFDRGWDVQPTDATAAAIVGFLAAGLADRVYGAGAV